MRSPKCGIQRASGWGEGEAGVITDGVRWREDGRREAAARGMKGMVLVGRDADGLSSRTCPECDGEKQMDKQSVLGKKKMLCRQCPVCEEHVTRRTRLDRGQKKMQK